MEVTAQCRAVRLRYKKADISRYEEMARLGAAFAKKEIAGNHENSGTLTREAEFRTLAISQVTG